LVAAGFSLRPHRLESLCHRLIAKWHQIEPETKKGGRISPAAFDSF
jgi:hypothetical protein